MYLMCALSFLTSLQVQAARTEPIQAIQRPKLSQKQESLSELGKMLFFDPRLSQSGMISCNSCHNLSTGGVDNVPGSIGHGWHIGDINSPTVLNSSLNLAQFWSGRVKTLEQQAAGPIANPHEMASSHEEAEQTIQSIPGYEKYFVQAFGDKKVTIDRITKAIGMFERTLMTPNAPFDQWLAGNDKAISPEAHEGYKLFKEVGCISCHNGPGVGGTMFQKFGVVKEWPGHKSKGRFDVTHKPEDMYVFKVPLLRNIELTAPYFHDGSVWSLEEAVRIMADVQLGKKLKDTETRKIVAFLKTLTGVQPRVIAPLLPPRTAKTPKPQLKLNQTLAH